MITFSFTSVQDECRGGSCFSAAPCLFSAASSQEKCTDKKIEASRKEHDMEFKILTTAALLNSNVIKLDS